MTDHMQADASPSAQRAHSEILKSLQAGNFEKEIPDLRLRMIQTPQDAGACQLLALAQGGLSDRHAERVWLRRALVLFPTSAHIRTLFGVSMLQARDIGAAHASFDQTLIHSPNFAAARYYRALIELEAMHFSRGWSDYEWRFSYPPAPGVWRDFPSPVWDGKSALDGKLLVWAEQSIATQILFASVLPELDLPDGLVIECAAPLTPIFQRALPHTEVVATATPADPRLSASDIAAHIPIGRLCGLRRQSRASFNQKVGYLAADSERAIDLMLDLTKPEHRTVGLFWRGAGRNEVGLSLTDLRPLLENAGVTWINLNGDGAVAEIEAFEKQSGIRIRSDHAIDTSADLDGLAALISVCDLIVAVDSPAAHLAGALGRPVWTLLANRTQAHWCWFSGHRLIPPKYSRWYPSMRLAWKLEDESHSAYFDRIGELLRRAIAAG
ncbi:MAG: hypothetical protein O2985_05270 [Proteobacteria bacterium]|nr:hypothetical protein [Pseudomonadota bacterium]